MMTQNEIERLHGLASAGLLTDRARVELSALAIRAVQLLVAQSNRIMQLKSLNEAGRRPSASNSPTSDFPNIFSDMFNGKFK